MADFFDDPAHPDRPQHPDYWRLVDVVNYFDGEATEGRREVDELVAEIIDHDSLMYMARQRAFRIARQTGLPQAPLAAVWLDAFVAGAKFEREGGHQAP